MSPPACRPAASRAVLMLATMLASAAVSVAAPRSGLDLAGFDRSVRPQDDLFRFASGGWLAATAIPADRSNYGTFTALEERSQQSVRELVEAAAADPAKPFGSDAQKVGDFYASFMDVDRVATLGLGPLQAEFTRILMLRSARDVYAYMGHGQRIGVPHPLMLYVGQDARDSTTYIAALYQSGLTMPDRDYYLATDERSAKLRAGLQGYVAQLLALAGERDPDGAARRIVALEGRMANHHWTKVQNRDPVRTYNRVTLAEAARLAPGFDWAAFLEGAGPAAAAVTVLDVNQPRYAAELARLVQATPVDDWRLYFRFRLLDAYAPFLAPAFEQARFDFRERALRGVEQPPPRWRRALQALDAAAGEIVGRLYVERHFQPEARAQVMALVGNLTRAFEASIDELDWMSPATKAEARRKLARFAVKIGHPDRWRDYSALEIRAGDLVGNVMRARQFDHARSLGKLGRPLDRAEWLMTPQTVNAYYNPPMNEIVFPAAILQPPFFDPGADPAVNYGAIGGVIGHELTHGFDDQGRKSDGKGVLRDWWTADDAKRFEAQADRLGAQYEAYAFPALPGLKLTARIGMGENIADLGGVLLGLEAYGLSLKGAPSPVLDGVTGTQRVFLGWAQVWRIKYRDDALRQQIVNGPHSPGFIRAYAPLRNVDAWYEAFDVKPGDALYIAPDQRVRIW